MHPLMAGTAHEQIALLRLLRSAGSFRGLLRLLVHGGGLLLRRRLGVCGHSCLVVGNEVFLALQIGPFHRRRATTHLLFFCSPLVMGLTYAHGHRGARLVGHSVRGRAGTNIHTSQLDVPLSVPRVESHRLKRRLDGLSSERKSLCLLRHLQQAVPGRLVRKKRLDDLVVREDMHILRYSGDAPVIGHVKRVGGVGDQPQAQYISLELRTHHLDLVVRPELVPNEHAVLFGMAHAPFLSECRRDS